MTILDDDRAHDVTPGALEPDPPRPAPDAPSPPAVDDDRVALALALRPALAAGLASAAVGVAAGGIFGSWAARLIAVVAALAGAAYAVLTARSSRGTALQAAFPVVAVVAGALALVTAGANPSDLPTAVADAIEAGRLLRPPVPFDPGWRAILVMLLGGLGFCTGSLAVLGNRARLAVAIPLPLVLLMQTTQPDGQQFVGSVGAFVPVLAALAVLFGGDTRRTETLDSGFEVKRTLRGLLALIPIVALLFAVNSADFLFPEPAYDPDDQPQKPRAVPLSEAEDRVLFEASAGPFTGPWRTGVLDIYDLDDATWKLPPVDQDRLVDAVLLAPERDGQPQTGVEITVRDLGDTAVLPVLGGATRIALGGGDSFKYDPRTNLVRKPSGRVPRGLTYVLQVPSYATAAELETAPAVDDDEFAEWLEAPDAPVAVQRLLADAPDNPWLRLDKLRQTLLEVVIAKGAGSPDAFPVRRVQELLAGDHEGTPFEIVAAEALLARWAGVPSRIGFGFDGLNDEEGVLTVRPRNSAQWLEVYFPTFGWVPLVGAPQQAETSLDNDVQRFDPGVTASNDVAVRVFVPFEVRDVTQLYERVRSSLFRWSPIIITAVALWLSFPCLAKLRRSAKRRRWAAAIGPRAQIAVEYCEFRDLATDLGVADIYSTPLEYLFDVEDDKEHAAFSWLAARALYGDLRTSVTDEDARAASAMGASLRRRIRKGQPFQVQVLALLSKASLLQPYETEPPNVRIPKLPRPWQRLRRRFVELRRTRRRKRMLAKGATA